MNVKLNTHGNGPERWFPSLSTIHHVASQAFGCGVLSEIRQFSLCMACGVVGTVARAFVKVPGVFWGPNTIKVPLCLHHGGLGLCPCLSVESTIYYHMIQWLISPRIPLGPLHLGTGSANLGYCGHKIWFTWGSPSLCFFLTFDFFGGGRWGSTMSWNRLWPPNPDSRSASASQVMELSFSLNERFHRYSRVFTKLFFLVTFILI